MLKRIIFFAVLSLLFIATSLKAQNTDKAIYGNYGKAIENSYENTTQDLRVHDVTSDVGSIFINNTTSVSGDWQAIQVVSDSCVIDTLTDSGRTGASISGLLLLRGEWVYGKKISRIKLTSGKIIAYRKK